MNTNMYPERHVVLIAPDVPWNTGNVGRTCLGANAFLHLIKPLGFSIQSREIKRAGLDYWNKIKLSVWDDFEAFSREMAPLKNEVTLFTKNAKKPFWDMPTSERMFLVFGSETRGITDEIFSMYGSSAYHIPTSREIRSLNLSTAAGIVLYESIRACRPVHKWL